jgi:hypothetical protein
MTRTLLLPLCLCVLLGGDLAAADALPLVDEVEWAPFQRHGLSLVQGLPRCKGAVPAEVLAQLHRLLQGEKSASAEVQKLLDPFCLIGVHINPESRVKAQRGPRAVRLVVDEPTYVLVKVHNEAGVTHPLRIAGPQLRTAKQKGPDRWLEATVEGGKPFGKGLHGRNLEYRVLRLVPAQAGKREATLQFDVSQRPAACVGPVVPGKGGPCFRPDGDVLLFVQNAFVRAKSSHLDIRIPFQLSGNKDEDEECDNEHQHPRQVRHSFRPFRQIRISGLQWIKVLELSGINLPVDKELWHRGRPVSRCPCHGGTLVAPPDATPSRFPGILPQSPGRKNGCNRTWRIKVLAASPSLVYHLELSR